MSTIKFKTVLRLEKLSKTTNEAPVCLRITKDRKTTYKTLLHVSPSCWNAKEQCVIRHPNADLFNAVISRKRADIERETCLLAEKYGTYLRLRSVLNKLRGFVGAGGLPVRDITEDFIRMVHLALLPPFARALTACSSTHYRGTVAHFYAPVPT